MREACPELEKVAEVVLALWWGTHRVSVPGSQCQSLC